MFFQLEPLRVADKYFLIALVFCGLACQREKIKPPIAQDKFAQIYSDYIVAADLTEKEDVGAILDSILAVHQLQRNDFRDNLQYYADHPVEWENFLNAVIKKLKNRMKAFEGEDLKEKLKPSSIQKRLKPKAHPK